MGQGKDNTVTSKTAELGPGPDSEDGWAGVSPQGARPGCHLSCPVGPSLQTSCFTVSPLPGGPPALEKWERRGSGGLPGSQCGLRAAGGPAVRILDRVLLSQGPGSSEFLQLHCLLTSWP